MKSYSSDETFAYSADVPYCHERKFSDTFSATTIVYEICGAVGILFFAAGIYRIIDNSKLVGWLLGLIAVLTLTEIVVKRLRLEFCGGLVSLLFMATIFGATIDTMMSLPTAALATVAASLIYLARYKTPFVLTVTTLALAAVYIIGHDTKLDLAAISLTVAFLLMLTDLLQLYRRKLQPSADEVNPTRRATI